MNVMNSSEFMGGHPGGCLSERKSGYLVTFKAKKLNKFFSKNKYGENDALQLARKFQREISDNYSLTINKYRKLKDEYGEYLEVHLKNNVYFVCDAEDQHFIDMYKWILDKSSSNPGRKYVITVCKEKNSKTRFTRVTTGFSHVFYKDCNTLNCRKHNLINVKPHKLHTSLTSEECNKIRMKMMEKYGKVNDIIKPKVLNPPCMCTDDGWIIDVNIYRYVSDEDGKYIEVMLPTENAEFFSMICDCEDEHLLKQHVWCAVCRPGKRRYYAVKVGGFGFFHRCIYDYKSIDHIDQNGLNNRRCNLRDGTTLNAMNKGMCHLNITGVTGICYEPEAGRHGARYRVCNGGKSYTINKYGEQAFFKAVKNRYKMLVCKVLNISFKNFRSSDKARILLELVNEMRLEPKSDTECLQFLVDYSKAEYSNGIFWFL
jgi:hypothetical protein